MSFRPLIVGCALALLASCATAPPSAPPTPAEPIALTPPAEQKTAPVVRRELPPEPAPPVAVLRPPTRIDPAPLSPEIPADAIYVCVVDDAGVRRQTVIEFVPRVLALCKRHPEMGPCQYERNVCRGAGGRVFAANGEEITMRTEAEYDKKVLRVRFRAN
jgi:hypothetical protein